MTHCFWSCLQFLQKSCVLWHLHHWAEREKHSFVEPHVLDWKTSQLLQLFQKSPAWIPSILHQGLGVSRVYMFYSARNISSPQPWEPLSASVSVLQRLQAASSWWVLPRLGLSTRLGLPWGTEAALHCCPVHQPGPGAGFVSGTWILMLNFPYLGIFVFGFCLGLKWCSVPHLPFFSTVVQVLLPKEGLFQSPCITGSLWPYQAVLDRHRQAGLDELVAHSVWDIAQVLFLP